MLTISDQVLGTFEAQARAARQLRFVRWWQAQQLGAVDAFTAGKWLDEYRGEAEVGGIDRDELLFVYIAARRRIPEPEAWQYVALMNVVWSDRPDADKLARIDAIARGVRADG